MRTLQRAPIAVALALVLLACGGAPETGGSSGDPPAGDALPLDPPAGDAAIDPPAGDASPLDPPADPGDPPPADPAAAAGCTACHGHPPVERGHFQVGDAFCSGCHWKTAAQDGVSILSGSTSHRNGTVEARAFRHATGFDHPVTAAALGLAACKACHGQGLDQLRCGSCHAIVH